MTSKLFTIFGEPQLSRDLHSQVVRALKEKKESQGLVEKILQTKSKALGRLHFLKFHLLHREFTGREIKALRFVFASTRLARHNFRHLKSCFWENR
ncbi:MAG: hypothetical protein ACKOA8_05645 [Deltaproteobacteria bacterium]